MTTGMSAPPIAMVRVRPGTRSYINKRREAGIPKGHTHDSGQGGSCAQQGHADSEGGVHQVVGHGTGIGGQKTGIEGVTTREHQWGGVEGALH